MKEKIIEAIKKHSSILKRDAWLKAKRFSISGTDIGAILGVNRWTSPFKLYDRKMNNKQVEVTLPMQRGTVLEPLIANKYEEMTKNDVIHLHGDEDEELLMYHPQYKFLIGSPDRFIIDKKGGVGVLEIKTASGYGVQYWADGIPEAYTLQTQTYMMILQAIFDKEGIDKVVYGQIAYMLDENYVRISDKILRDKEEESIIVAAASDFVFRLDNEMPPDVDDYDDVKIRYVEYRDKDFLEVTKETYDLIEKRQAMKSYIKHIQDDVTAPINNLLKETDAWLSKLIGNYEGIKYKDTLLATRKKTKKGNRTLSIKSQNLRELRKENKGEAK